MLGLSATCILVPAEAFDPDAAQQYFGNVKITTDGQVTIPQELRERYGLLPETEVEFITGEGGVVIRPARTATARFHEWLEKARGSATVKTTTDEVMRLTRGED